MRLHVPIKLRWSDLDAYGHVNNVEMLRLLEEARVQAFWTAADGQPGAATQTLVASQQIEYLKPVPYLREPLDIQLWLTGIGGASFDVGFEIWSPVGIEPAMLYARAAVTIVQVDAATDRPRRLDPTERTEWTPYLGEPVAFTIRKR